MGYFTRRIIEIPLGSLENLDERFFAQIKMGRAGVMKKFSEQYERTRREAFDKMKVRAVVASYGVVGITDETLVLEGEHTVSSSMLSQLFAGVEEIAMVVVTAQGYEEMESSENNMLDALFFDAWGTAAASRGHAQIVKNIREEMDKHGLYATQSWSPGQHNVALCLQEDIFRLLMPEDIGVTLGAGYMMHPQKSASSFIGISRDKGVTQIRPCDFCNLRENCPSAYS